MDVLLALHANLSRLNHGLDRQDTQRPKELQASVAILDNQSSNDLIFAVQVIFENINVSLVEYFNEVSLKLAFLLLMCPGLHKTLHISLSLR